MPAILGGAPAALTSALTSALAAALAAATPADDKVSPGLAGFLTVFGLALVTVLLIRSMVGHLRKVRYSPEPGQEEQDQPGQQEPGDSADPPG
jgi:hypothetical protein